MRSLGLVVLAACSFKAGAAGDAGSIDGPRALDAAHDTGGGGGDGSAKPTCLDLWRAGTLGSGNFGAPRELTQLERGGNIVERDPSVTLDGSAIFFSSNRLTNDLDIFVATLAPGSDAFDGSSIAPIGTIDDAADQQKITFAGSDLDIAVFASSVEGDSQNFELAFAIRSNTSNLTSFNEANVAPFQVSGHVIDDENVQNDPWISPDGKRVYYADSSSGEQKLLVATDDGTGNFPGGASAPVANINNDGGDNHADATLSQDELVIVVSEVRNGATTLYYASRADVGSAFGTPQVVPMSYPSNHTGDGHLTADGCELYFSSDRSGGNDHIFVVDVTP
jgi:Tol biopolymer transport system component|nr:hypothetical protein [Kofleriaceae bacterium]